jgi:hypothetical protein
VIKELEQKIEELFKSQGLEKCTERWKSTTKYVTKTEEAYIDALKLRLKQGGVNV